ncbi:hypothetical protein CXB51_020669 [Gossypium anomalum]|uniref:Integrase catalytic domain-containing protein n=1 Tax=Gossypium anomalum TaxID=47600 RepID=A0A8J6CTR5_9ROSI|nr:hypothetical protein CXB51_020669 [Gossypium anomalum]
MATVERLFKDLDRSFASKIKIGNGDLIEAKGKGNLVINTCSGNKVISEVLYVPDIDQNLLSVGQLVEKGSFMLDLNQLEKKAYTSPVDNTGLWYRRLGHVNFRSLELLHKLNLVDDISKIEAKDTICEVCQLDDLTRFCWVYFLKQKSEVFEAFSKFKALAENQSGCKIKALRTDNGTEYLSERFQKLCEQAGIHNQLTTIYTPQQNRVCERKNRTVLDIARCLLFQSKLPSKFWAEAVNTSVYLLNKLPTHAVKDKTPFEAWHGLKPTVSHLKVFGCVCYALIPAEKRTKLERKAAPGIFVGYNSIKKGYKLIEEDQPDNNLEPVENQPSNEDFDDAPMRGTRTIADIYQRCDVAIVEPSDFKEATRDKHWKKAMKTELEMIHKNDTWELVERPDDKKVIGVQWVFRAKYNADGSLNKYKARLVVKSYSQQYGIDFMETFVQVARLDTIKLLFALAAQKQ